MTIGRRMASTLWVGAGLTEDGRAFLHHARALVGIADQALDVLRGRRRSLRVDVLDTRVPRPRSPIHPSECTRRST
ncbi:hypothetical protein [Nonomuraea sp. NPDC049784]|uniref:hypothetical protein n=1 Tax=Nonomuraea sp. NPDC049784 TaxID=3154361 RepID=UPI0033F2DFED